MSPSSLSIRVSGQKGTEGSGKGRERKERNFPSPSPSPIKNLLSPSSLGWPDTQASLQGDRWFSLPAIMTSRLASVACKMASKVFIEETDKNFEFITEILFRFRRFGDFKVPIVIENWT